MPSIKIQHFIATLALLVGTPTFCSAETALRLGYILPPASQLGAGADVFASELAKRTQGRYTIEQYPGAMLGGDVAMMHDLQVGSLDLAFVTAPAIPYLVPAEGIWSIPYLFRSSAQARVVLDGPIGADYLAKFEGTHVVGLAWGENGMRHLTTSGRVVRLPADMVGLKVRVPQSEAMAAGFKAMGADARQLPFDQVYGSLQSKRLEAEENPIATIVSARFSRVQSTLTLTAHVYDPAVILMSQDSYDALSPEDRTALRAAAKAAAVASRDSAARFDESGLAALKAAGMRIVEDVDRDSFAKAVAAAGPQWDALYGAKEVARLRQAAEDKTAASVYP